MNTEDFVTYEQALTLKKLGFDEGTEYYYSRCTGLTHAGCPNNFNADNLVISAPTLAQAQKWLIKKKNYYVQPDGFGLNSWLWDIVNLKTGDLIHMDNTSNQPNHYNSYEEALSAGITECIKLLN